MGVYDTCYSSHPFHRAPWIARPWTVRHEPQQIAGAGLVLASKELGVMLPSGRPRGFDPGAAGMNFCWEREV